MRGWGSILFLLVAGCASVEVQRPKPAVLEDSSVNSVVDAQDPPAPTRAAEEPDEKPVKTQISMRRVSRGMSQLGMKISVDKQCISLRLLGLKHRRGNQRFTRLFGGHWRK